jgi:hypothetical protein
MRTPLIFFFTMIVLLTGCADKPKPIGQGLIDPNDVFTVADTTIVAAGDSSYTAPVNGGFSTNTLAGRFSPNDELIALYKFTPNASVDSLAGAVIDTAEFRLYVTYALGPASPPIEFEVREALQSWSQSTFTTDSMSSFQIGSAVLGTFSDSMNVTSNIKARIDTAVARRWANAFKDTNAPAFHGFAVRAKQGVTTGIVGFLPFGSFTSVDPRFVIKYSRNGTRDSLIFSSGEDTYGAQFVAPPALFPFEVRGAFGVRGKVKFDLSSFAEKPIVNNATLTLVADTVNSVRSIYSPDSLIALLSLSGSVADSSSSTQFAVGVKRTDPVLGKVYTFNITTITQRWINALDPNFGLSIHWAYETNTADRVTFYPKSDAARAPRLTIIYSRK